MSPFSSPKSLRFCSTDMSLPTRVRVRVAGAAHAMDLLQIERLAATQRPDTPPLPAAPLVDLMVHVASVCVNTQGSAKEAALLRLKQTESPTLVAAFFFALGVLWCHISGDDAALRAWRLRCDAGGQPEGKGENATKNSLMSFQAAAEVS